MHSRPDPIAYSDEAYTYTPEFARGLSEWIPVPAFDDGYVDTIRSYANIRSPVWNGVFNVGAPSPILKSDAKAKEAWAANWAKVWATIGKAHEARVYNQEVMLVDDELKIS